MSKPSAANSAGQGPYSDDDTFEAIDQALGMLADRRGLFLGDEHATIGLLAGLIVQAERFLPEAVTNARMNGASWDQIADRLGTSADEARIRFDPDSPIADGRWPYNY